jgi:Dyp-type peroxidase family
MPVDLTRDPRTASVDYAAAPYATMVEKLQANILKPHGRDHARHLFIRFSGPAEAVRSWIRTHVQVTSAANQIRTSAAYADAKRQGQAYDGGGVTGFLLSATGYRGLELDPGKLPSRAFNKGMKDRSKYVVRKNIIFGIDFKLSNRDPRAEEWEPGFRSNVDALLMIADDDEPRADAAAAAAAASLVGVGSVVHLQKGRVLRRNMDGQQEPIEHFGYFDGISQPLYSSAELTTDDTKQGGAPRTGLDWDPAASLDLLLAADPFAGGEADAFGSFMVYRKLQQDFESFKAREEDLGEALGGIGELAGAYVVGRFEDGTPVIAQATPDPGTTPGNRFLHTADKDGQRCPMHAHIRKTNPRGTTPRTTLEEERRRRITRRGIPYGKPHPDLGCDPAVSGESEAGDERGLLFMCFQANIEEQFEFIQRVWVDNNEFPKGLNPFTDNTGDDPLIGQDRDEPQRWPKKYDSPAAGTKKFNFESDVRLKGGEYFFAPSLPFLASL